MKAATVIRHCRTLRRMCGQAEKESQANVARIHGSPVVGDLAPFTFARIGVWAQADRLECALGQWLAEARA